MGAGVFVFCWWVFFFWNQLYRGSISTPLSTELTSSQGSSGVVQASPKPVVRTFLSPGRGQSCLVTLPLPFLQPWTQHYVVTFLLGVQLHCSGSQLAGFLRFSCRTQNTTAWMDHREGCLGWSQHCAFTAPECTEENTQPGRSKTKPSAVTHLLPRSGTVMAPAPTSSTASLPAISVHLSSKLSAGSLLRERGMKPAATFTAQTEIFSASTTNPIFFKSQTKCHLQHPHHPTVC